MNSSLVTVLVATAAILVGCQESVEYRPAESRTQNATAGTPFNPEDNQQSSDQESAQVEETAQEEEATAEEEPMEEQQQAPVALTNQDLLAMDEVVVTSVISANGTVYFSDVGRTSITNAAAVANAGVAPSGKQLTAAEAFQVKAGQRVTFCNHASSSANLRVHAANGSAFSHWGGGQQLAPGACSSGQGYPETINAGAVGNTPGNNLYNHNQSENISPIYLNIAAQ